MYARINLDKTNYIEDDIDIDARLLRSPDTNELEKIYDTYVKYKKFSSVMPLFPEEYKYHQADVFGYYDNDKLVAFTLCFRYNDRNIAANQFAWDYNSLKWICAYYKFRCYDYIYLGDAANYKQHIQGFEILGPRE